MLDVITIGHSTLDTFVKLPDAHLHCQLDTEACELCINYADKVLVEDIKTNPGGNALNTAIGLARLELATGIVTLYGQDHAGLKVKNSLKQEGVRMVGKCEVAEGKTDQSVILNFQGERTILAYHYPWEYKFPIDSQTAPWVYLTSLNENFQNCHREFLQWLEAQHRGSNKVRLAYNPGTHEIQAGIRVNQPILEKCQVLILNKEEAEKILGGQVEGSGEKRMRGLLSKLGAVGPGQVIITDAQNGSYAYNGDDFYQQSVYRDVERVEMTGAGDAFSTGLLAALIKGQDLPTALKWGTVEAAGVIQRVGATPGLLKMDELGRMIDQL